MKLSLTAIITAGCIASVAITLWVMWLLFSYSIRWNIRHNYCNEPQNKYFILNLVVAGIPAIILVGVVLKYAIIDITAIVTWLVTIAIGAVLLCNKLNRYLKKFRIPDAPQDNIAERLWSIRRHLYAVELLSTILIGSTVALGTIATLKWLIPDVVTVVSLNNSKLHYELFTENSPQLAHNYVNNLTSDTIYRVVVSYGIPPHDTCNIFAVTDTVPPHSFKEVSGWTDYTGSVIPLYSKPRRNRFGKEFRKKVSYFTDRNAILAFRYTTRSKRFGFTAPNRLVDHID